MSERYHHGNLRDELISRGLQKLNREGIGVFSLRALSRELGVSHAAAYRHFRSRDELLRAIVTDGAAAFRRALFESVSPDAQGKEALMQLGIGYVRFFVDNPEILPLFSVLPSDDNPVYALMGSIDTSRTDRSDETDNTGDDAFDLFRQTALQMKAEDPYRDLPDRELLLGFWSKVHGLATLLVTQPALIPEESRDAAIDRLVRTPF